MNIRITRSLVFALAIAVTVFAGTVSHGAAQELACDAYACYYPDGTFAYSLDPGYGAGCDPYLGCVNIVAPPVYGPGCDPYLGCVNIVQPPVYGPGCDPYTGCYYPGAITGPVCDPILGCY
jgi:hypothetical protein